MHYILSLPLQHTTWILSLILLSKKCFGKIVWAWSRPKLEFGQKSKKYHTLVKEQQLYKKVCGSLTCSTTSDAMATSNKCSCPGCISSTEVHLYSSVFKFGSIVACFFAISMLSGSGSIPRASPPSLDKGYVKISQLFDQTL